MIRRSQLVFCAAVVLAAVIIGTQLPLGEILSQRAAIAGQTRELNQLRTADASLAAQVRALGQDATVARIAHEQYGLVHRGQLSYVILPAPGSGGSGPLSSVVVPPGDVMPSDAAIAATSNPATPEPLRTGLVGQVLDRLEFWRWAF